MLVTCRVKYLNRILCLSESRLYRFVFIWLGMEGGFCRFLFYVFWTVEEGEQCERREKKRER
jgi:hypothetical protein